MTYSRRTFLQLGVTGVVASLAGCSGVRYGIQSEIESRTDDRVAWSTTVGVPIALSIANQTLFVVTNESIAAVDPTDGEQRWEVSLPKEQGRVCYMPPVAIEDGRIYVSGCRGTFAFDYEGTQLWQSDEPTGVTGFAPTADRLYGARGNELYALRRDTGELAFTELVHQSQNTGFAGPTQGPEWFYYSLKGRASDDIGLIAVDPATAETQWKLPLGSLKLDHAPTYAEGMLYVATSDSVRGSSDGNRLYAVDADSQTVEWESPTRAVSTAPVATSDRIVFASAGREDSYIRSVGRSAGDDEWTTQFETLTHGIDRIRVIGNTVYAVLDSDEIVALDITDGSERWRFSKTGHVDALPVVYEDRTLVPTGNRVWALDQASLG